MALTPSDIPFSPARDLPDKVREGRVRDRAKRALRSRFFSWRQQQYYDGYHIWHGMKRIVITWDYIECRVFARTRGFVFEDVRGAIEFIDSE